MLEKIYLVRHGETEWNLQSRVQGSTDVPLADSGRQQVRSLASALDRCGASAIWSSDLARARETASILASYLKMEVVHDEDLREIDCGEWEGRVAADVLAEDRERFERWIGDATVCAPGGESFDDVGVRVRRVLARAQALPPPATLVIVSHAAALRALASALLDLPVLTVTRFTLDAASLSVLSYWSERQQYRLERWNLKTC